MNYVTQSTAYFVAPLTRSQSRVRSETVELHTQTESADQCPCKL